MGTQVSSPSAQAALPPAATQVVSPVNLWQLDWEIQEASGSRLADWWDNRWQHRLEVTVPFSWFPRRDVTVQLHFDPDDFAQKLGWPAPIDPGSLRVVEIGGTRVATAWLTDDYAAPDDGPETLLSWVVSGTTEPKQQRRYHLYFNAAGDTPTPSAEDRADERPLQNVLQNPEFRSPESATPPDGWTLTGQALSPSDYLSASRVEDDPSGIRVRLDEKNRHRFSADPIVLSQRVRISNPEGQTWTAAATFYLEKGESGCPVEVRIRQYDRENREVGQATGRSTHRAFTTAEGQRVTAVVPVPLDPQIAELEYVISIRPVLYSEQPGKGRVIVQDEQSHLSLLVSNPLLKPRNEVPLDHSVPAGFVSGRMNDAPLNAALLLTGGDTFIFNTFPTMRSWGIGEPVHFDIRQGTVEMWLSPRWEVDDGQEHMFFRTLPAWYAKIPGQGKPGDKHPYVELAKLGPESGNKLQFLVRDQNRQTRTVQAPVPFARNEWVHLAATWDYAAGQMALFANGRKVADLSDGGPWPVESVSELIEVGNAHSGSDPGDEVSRSLRSAEAAIDELRISDTVRYHEHFRPAAKEYELDTHTRALFHFECESHGIHHGGDRFVPGVTTIARPCEDRFVILDRLQEDGEISRSRIRVLQIPQHEAEARLQANRPSWQRDREKLFVRHPDPSLVRRVHKVHEQIVEPGGAAFEIPVGGDYPPEMRLLRIETMDSESRIRGLHITASATADLTSADRMFGQAFVPQMTESEKARALFGFVTTRLPWWTEATEQSSISGNDPIKALNCYGGMICSSQSRVLADLFVAAGFSARTLGIGHHVVCEAYYDGDWHLMDMTYGLYPLKRDFQTIASWDDFGHDQFLGEQVTPQDGQVPWNTGDNRSWAYHYHYFRSDSGSPLRRQMISVDADLDPHTVYDRYWYNWGKRNEVKGSVRFNYWEYGNGEIEWSPDLSRVADQAESITNLRPVLLEGEWRLVPIDESKPSELVYEVRSPYVVVDGSVEGVSDPPRPDVALSVDGGATWSPLNDATGTDGRFVLDLGKAVNAVYAYQLRLHWPVERNPVALADLRIRTVCQTNAPSLPALDRGVNRIDVSAVEMGGPVKLRYEWTERHASRLSVRMNALGWFPVRGRDYVRLYIAGPGEPFDVSAAIRNREGGPVNATVHPMSESLSAGPPTTRLSGSDLIEMNVALSLEDANSEGLHPFQIRVETSSEARLIDAVVLVAEESHILGPDRFDPLEKGMKRLDDADVYGVVLTVDPLSGDRGHARAILDVDAEGDYLIWAYLGGAGRRAGAFDLVVDDATTVPLKRQGYEGLQIRELGLSWYWARGKKTHLSPGRHNLTLSAAGDGSRFRTLLLVKAPDDAGAEDFERVLENLLLNRNYRPWRVPVEDARPSADHPM